VTAKYATDPGDLPQTFVIKLPAQDDTVRDRVTIGYRSECTFYASVADRVRVPTPQCFYCEISEDAMDYALLLADQAPAFRAIRSRAAANKRRALPRWRWPDYTDPVGATHSGSICPAWGFRAPMRLPQRPR